MTREEAKQKTFAHHNMNAVVNHINGIADSLYINRQDILKLIDEIYNYFEARIAELEASKLCGNCIHMEKQGEDYYICNDTEFQTCTTPDTECFLGYSPKGSK